MTIISGLLLLAVSVISTIGYFRVQAALDSETEYRLDAEDASRLASGALEKVFGRFAPDSRFGEAGREQQLTQPVLSDDDVAMLEDLLVYYQQLASRNSDDPDLAFRAQLAQCRVGEINEHLGNFELAADAFEKSAGWFFSLAEQQAVRDPKSKTAQSTRIRSPHAR